MTKAYLVDDSNTVVFDSDEKVESMFPGRWSVAYTIQDTLSWSNPNLDATYFHIDVGPFFDRFGTKALAVTSSGDPEVRGLVTLILPRKFVDLKRPDLLTQLDLLVSKGLINAEDKSSILNPTTTDYERHIKGLPQPQ